MFGVLGVLFGVLGVLVGVPGVLVGHNIFFWLNWCLQHWDVVFVTFRFWDGVSNIFKKKMCRLVFYSLSKLF